MIYILIYFLINLLIHTILYRYDIADYREEESVWVIILFTGIVSLPVALFPMGVVLLLDKYNKLITKGEK